MNALFLTAWIACLVTLFHCLVSHRVGGAIQRKMTQDTRRAISNLQIEWIQLFQRHFHPRRRMHRFLRRAFGLDFRKIFSEQYPLYGDTPVL